MRSNWIFQSANKLTPSQQDSIRKSIDAFLEKWNAHGTPVPGTGEIKHDRFILLQAEAGSTSGCSIDSMTREISSLLSREGILRTESGMIFYHAGNGEISAVDFREVENLIASGEIGPETVIFDNTMGQSDDLSKWEVPLKETWLARYLPEISHK
jgi:hypothetical protein